MKLNKCIMILVILMVILNVFTKKVKRSKAASKIYALAEIRAYVYHDKTGKSDANVWINLKTGFQDKTSSGFVVQNLYDSGSFNYEGMQAIESSGHKRQYFFSFRDLSLNNMSVTEDFNWRNLEFNTKKGTRYVFWTGRYTGRWDYINQSEMIKLKENMKSQATRYSKDVLDYLTELNGFKNEAESLTSQKEKNISSRSQYDDEVQKWSAELVLNRENLTDSEASSEKLKLQIRNLESDMALIRSSKLIPLLDIQKVEYEKLNSMEREIEQNNKKLSNIVPIDQNDLSATAKKIKDNLIALNKNYLQYDPRHESIELVKNHFNSMKDQIPSVIA